MSERGDMLAATLRLFVRDVKAGVDTVKARLEDIECGVRTVEGILETLEDEV